jgi:voltage-gated potassium channel
MLDDLTDHFILCGFGRMGEIIAREFARQHVPFVVIERNAERMHLAMDHGFLAVEADASNEDVLRRVGIDRARGLVAAVSTDAENVYAVLSARLLKPDLFIVGRAETEDARTKLTRAGADRVISPYHLGGLQLAQTALRPAVVDFVQLATSSENMDLNLEQVHIGRLAARGSSLIDAGLRSASAWSSSASAAPTARWTSTRARNRDARRRRSGRARPREQPQGPGSGGA